MSEKNYQISPIELVQWAEPLFGFGVGKATGFSEKTCDCDISVRIDCYDSGITDKQ